MTLSLIIEGNFVVIRNERGDHLFGVHLFDAIRVAKLIYDNSEEIIKANKSHLELLIEGQKKETVCHVESREKLERQLFQLECGGIPQ